MNDNTSQYSPAIPLEVQTSGCAYDDALLDHVGRERFHQTVVENTSDVILTITESSRITFANPAVEGVFGYEPDALVGESLAILIPDRLQDRHFAAIDRYLRTGEARLDWDYVELPGQHRDGHEVPLAISFREHVHDGAHLFTGLIRDVTERTEREEQLRKEQALTRSVLQSIPDVFYLYDEEGTLLEWNDRAVEASGYTDDEIAAMNAIEFIAEDDRERVASAMSSAFEDGAVETVEGDFLTKSGERIPYEFTGTTVTDEAGDVIGLTGIGRDVAAREEREARLRQERELTERLLETAPVALTVQSPEGETEMANRRASDLLGLSRAEIVGGPDDAEEWSVYDADGSPLSRDELAPALVRSTGEPVFDQEIAIERPTGERQWFLVNAAPVFDAEGDLERVITAAADVTERKHHQRELEAQRERLEIELNEVFGRITDAVIGLDEAGTVSYANERAQAMIDRTERALLGEPIRDALPAAIVEPVEQAYEGALDTGETTAVEVHEPSLDAWFEVHVYPSATGASLYLRDVSDRKHFEQTLTALHESSRELLHVDTANGVCDVILETASDVLDLPGTAIYLADDGALHLHSCTGAVEELIGDRSAAASNGDSTSPSTDEDSASPAGDEDSPPPRANDVTSPSNADEESSSWQAFGTDSIPWRAFTDGEPVVVNDFDRSDLATEAETSWGSCLWVPLGEHGVFTAVATDESTFDGEGRTLAEILAATAEAGLDRVEQEHRRKRREYQLEALAEASGRLLLATAPQSVCDIVVEVAAGPLEIPIAMVALRDEEAGTLRTRARSRLAEQLVDAEWLFDPDAELAWQAYAENEVAILREVPVADDATDVDADADAVDPDTCSLAILPLGRHGVFVIGTTDGAISDDDLSMAQILTASTEPALAELLAANTESSLDRADHERQLVERDELLREQNQRLERLNRVNDVIRDITKALVAASSRTEIEREVCTQLTRAGPYVFAWVGENDLVDGSVSPRAWAGAENGYLDAVTGRSGDHDEDRNEAASEREPAERAVETGRTQVVDDVPGDPPFPPWRQEALKRGYRACLALPLTYRDMLYGVLAVYADHPNAFDDLERSVLAELAETTAHAINAVESKKALVSDDLVEVEFVVRDPSIPFLAVTETEACTFEFDSIISQADGGYRVFYTIRDAAAEGVLAFMDAALGVDETRLVADHDGECLFECTVDEQTFFDTLLAHGAVPQRFTAAGGEGRVVVALPESADIRAFLGMVQTTYERSEFVARREKQRERRTRRDFDETLHEAMTDRQREVLHTAYESGYFESPRANTGSEISEVLGVSQPTFNNHLRTAQRKLLDLVFDRPDGE